MSRATRSLAEFKRRNGAWWTGHTSAGTDLATNEERQRRMDEERIEREKAEARRAALYAAKGAVDGDADSLYNKYSGYARQVGL